MSPDSSMMSPGAIKKIKELIDDGATVIMDAHPTEAPGMADDGEVEKTSAQLFHASAPKGKLITGLYRDDSFDKLGITRDVIVTDSTGGFAHHIAWNHRTGEGFDIYFISNQDNNERTIDLSLRVSGKVPELWDPLTGETRTARDWKIENGRTILPVKLEANGSVFVVLHKAATIAIANKNKNWPTAKTLQTLKPTWTVKFDKAFGGPGQPVIFNALTDWSKNADDAIKYYSGTAVYTQSFNWMGKTNNSIWLDVGKIYNLADVYVNDIFCGTAWTYPYRVNISKALKSGNNELRIEVSNTWANRIIGDHALPEDKRVTWTNAVYRLDGKPLLPAGLIGPVRIIKTVY